MSLNINTNLSSLIVQSSLNKSTNALNKAIERMTTGFKVNSARDNAANYGITTQMSTKISAYEIAEDNVSIGLDLLKTASDSLSLISEHLTRIRDLTTQASNGTYGVQSLKAINAEVNARVDEIERLYLNTEFNGITLFPEVSIEDYNNVQLFGETYASEVTKLEELGITDSSFNIYDKDNNLVKHIDVSGSDTIGDLFSTLNNQGFRTKISSGVMSISSKEGLYISGDLADILGIGNAKTEYVSSTSQTSSIPVNYESISTSTTEEIVYTTTTVQTTQVSTIETTTTTPIVQTSTVKTSSTTGVSQTSSAKIQYNSTSVISTNTYSINYDATVNLTITAISAFNTWSITPTTCTTFRDIDNLVMSLKQNDELKAYSIISLGTSDESSYSYFRAQVEWLSESDLIFITADGQKIRNFDQVATVSTKTRTVTTTATATTATKLSDLGLNSNQYITVYNNGKTSTITCSSTSTLASIKSNLSSKGITMGISGGSISVSGSDTSYIKSMSADLASALKLDNDFYTITTTKTEKTTTIYQTTTSSTTKTSTIETTKTTSDVKTVTTFVTTTLTVTETTKFSDLGINSNFNITVNSDGTSSIINVNKDMTIGEVMNALKDKGIDANISAGILNIKGEGDCYVSSSVLTSSFGLSAVNKVIGNSNVNTDSGVLKYTPSEENAGNNIYAPGSLVLQVGIHSDAASQITINTSFELIGYNILRNIALNENDYFSLIDNMLSIISSKQTEFGADENRLESALEEINTHYENLVSSRSTLRDADVAGESSEYIRNQILQQASATLLATANQSPSLALQLL